LSGVLAYYFDFSCPYAYLASTQVDALAARAGVEVEYRPFLLGAVFKALDADPMARASPARARLNALDMLRWAEHWGVPFVMPPGHPNRTVLALRTALASPDLPRAAHALFRAYWVEGRDLSQAEVVASALDAAGLDGKALVLRAESPAIKAELRARTDEALARGVFGAPAFVVGDELYWGQDRLDLVARALGLGGWESENPPAKGERRHSFDFWYDFSSPFAYLASTQVERIAKARAAEVVWRPFLLGALFKAIGTADVPIATFPPAKQRHMQADMDRFANRYRVPFRFPSRFPMRTVLPLRAVLAAGADAGRLSRAIFHAYWADDRDIGDPGVVAAVCSETGLDPALVARAEDPAIKQALRDSTQAAERAGLCGAPSFVVDGLLFWGQDRLEFVEQALDGWQPRSG
jgi:2-hydroxychromene-2-carboxylate isomerase